MTRLPTARRLARDEGGQTSIEWVMILAGFVLPMVYVFRLLLAAMSVHYELVTFLETLPFP